MPAKTRSAKLIQCDDQDQTKDAKKARNNNDDCKADQEEVCLLGPKHDIKQQAMIHDQDNTTKPTTKPTLNQDVQDQLNSFERNRLTRVTPKVCDMLHRDPGCEDDAECLELTRMTDPAAHNTATHLTTINTNHEQPVYESVVDYTSIDGNNVFIRQSQSACQNSIVYHDGQCTEVQKTLCEDGRTKHTTIRRHRNSDGDWVEVSRSEHTK